MKTQLIRLFVLSLAFAAFGAISMAPTASFAVTVQENPNEGQTYSDGYGDGYDYGYQQGLAQGNTGAEQGSACCGQQQQQPAQ